VSIHLSEDELQVPDIELGLYEHYKGNRYEVVGVGLDTEDHTAQVIYKPLYESNVPFWIRPYDMFLETVEVDGKVVPRFQRIKK
jgi:hypothetical protein